MEYLSAADAAVPIVTGPGAYERRAAHGRIPEWFSPSDLVDAAIAPPHGELVHGELV